MENKGEVLNQIAIISDLLENVNFKHKSGITISVIFYLDKEDFDIVLNAITKEIKYKPDLDELNDTFSIRIGQIDFVFNMNSV